MTGLTGTWFLVRFTARRDLARILLWIAGISALLLLTAASVKGLYPTAADLAEAAAATTGNAAAIAFNGPAVGLTTLGGEVAFQGGTIGLVLVALMSLLSITRYTRAEEESGRTELLRATVLGRDAQTAAALLVVTAMNLAVAAVTALGLIALRLPVTGSVVLGVSLLANGTVFTAVTLVTTQVTANSRLASGLSGLVLGYAFVVRAVGDVRGGGLSWLSPIGWSQKPRPFAGDVWWPFAVPVVATGLLMVTAWALTARRDWGSGLLQARPGPAAAGPRLGTPLGLAVRLNRASLLAWAASLLGLGLVYGSIADDIGNFVGDNTTLKDLLAAAGGTDLTDAYFGTAVLTMALVACCYPVQIVQRLRSEETALHAEPVLATPTSRLRWIGGHLALAGAGSVLVLVAAGLGAGVPYALAAGQARQVPALVGAALAYLPAVWLLAGLAVAVYGLAPRAVGSVWVLLTGCFVIGLLGEVLKPPHWVAQLSPFQQTPQLPAASLSLAPLALQTAGALALLAVGILGFRRRDLG